jgi:uncharacterized sulfatase
MDSYLQKFEKRMDQLQMNEGEKKERRNYRNQLASILFTDDALRDFLKAYSGRSDFRNTIFIITGDHRMPEIPIINKIDRYHVPLIIYSPDLRRPAKFSALCFHLDIVPSLLAFLHNKYKIEKPSIASWMGNGLDTARYFRNLHAYPLMHTKNNLIDFVMGTYHLNGNDVFRIYPDLNEDLIQDPIKLKELRRAFDQFLQRNEKIINGSKLIPDSLYLKYYPH